MKHDRRPADIDEILAQDDVVDRVLRKAARNAVRQHWAAGYRVAEWRNGRVVWVGPDGSVAERPRRLGRR